MEIILTHENADFDAVAGLLAASRLYPGAQPVLPERLNQNVKQFLALYQNELHLIQFSAVHASDVTKIVVVDTQRIAQIKGIRASTPVQIIDHHPLSTELQNHQSFKGDPVGAVTTLLVEQIQEQNISLNSLEATLMALGIYEDTGSMIYGTTTVRDIRAAAWLVEQGAVLDTVRRFLSQPLSEEQQNLLEMLIAGAETRIIEGYTVVVASATLDHYVAEISSIAHRMRDTLDLTALFILVQMPKSLQVVARSTDDAIDVGNIARLLDGGGHPRAAAASIHDKTIAECTALIWQQIVLTAQPARRVGDLMSYSVHTVETSESLGKIAHHLRRIGHEGYPVIENGKVVGLLNQSDLNRALEHGLEHFPVRDVMLVGTITLRPADAISTLEQRIVESSWGQIPVVDDAQKLVGIVTRTDLIKYWAQTHSSYKPREQKISPHQIEAVVGLYPAQLIEMIAEQAREKGVKLYLVGGVVRDLILDRHNLDIDFVLEDNAIEFARKLQSQYGGQVNVFTPFGTAKWILDESAAHALNIPFDQLPEHIDFATARNEFYEHPTALPTVYNSSIKLDLQRRDFTINTLALQLSPVNLSGSILDFYGGLGDIQARLIRVLHSLSFVDDPTRILRAVRFERRLGFTIEPRTADLITIALPMLGRITGERLRNELVLLLKEHEPAQGLLELQQRGILQAIHPVFMLDEQIIEPFKSVRQNILPWRTEGFEQTDLYWHIIGVFINSRGLASLCERLMFGRSMADSLLGVAHLTEIVGILSQSDLRPSQIVRHLANVTELALLGLWLTNENPIMRERIRDYWTIWRHVQPITNGHKLRELGLKPGPCYSLILNRLRDARLDGDVQDDSDEQELLHTLIHNEAICDDSL